MYSRALNGGKWAAQLNSPKLAGGLLPPDRRATALARARVTAASPPESSRVDLGELERQVRRVSLALRGSAARAGA